MPRVLVIVPTSSYRTTDFLRAAESLGIEVTIASEEDPPLDLGDRFVRIDCSDPEAAADAILEIADRTPIDGVVAVDDAGVVAASLVSRRLGLPHHTPEAAAATRDKLRLRWALADAEVPQPRFALVTGHEDPGLGYPLVLKPRTGTASRGVLRVDSPSRLPDAIDRVRAIATGLGEDGSLLAEEYVAGREVAVEGLVTNGQVAILAVFDKPDQVDGPTFPETLLVAPTTLADTRELERVVRAGVAALGLQHGPIHAEARIRPDGRVVLGEIAARSIGGLCGRSLRFGLSGAGLEELILGTALGRSPARSRQPRPTGVMMLHVPRPGTLRRVEGTDRALAVEGVTEVDITIPPGSQVTPLPEGGRYLGFVFATGPTTDLVADRLRTAADLLEVIIE